VDLYIVLGVRQDASDTDIKRAYRRLARRLHPDINPGDRAADARFREVLDAYETLIDRERRTKYDAGALKDPEPAPRKSEFEGFDFSTRGVDYSASFGDLVADVLLEREARPGEGTRGSDRHMELRVGFRSAVAGDTHPVTVSRQEVCRECDGRGVLQAAAGACGTCHGSGAVRSVRGHMVFSRTCAGCGGTGQQRPRACRGCGGSGQAMCSERLTVRMPAGVADGDTIRVPGKGDVGLRGGSPGDLYVKVLVEPDTQFTRHGDDLHLTVPVAIHEAALGARVEVEGLDGPVRLRVPPGTQSGQRFRVRERGVPSSRTGVRGDLIVEVRLMLPPTLDERSKELLREFGRLNDGMSKRAERGKAYFMISAVAQKYNIHPQTLRLYEREGLLTPSRTEGNTRLYSEEDLERLETILSLTRDLGVNLAGVEIILNMREKIELMQSEVNEFMDYVKRELARGIDDWEQRLGTAMVKAAPTGLARRVDVAPVDEKG
jgi:molecular chaperone DnaJ